MKVSTRTTASLPRDTSPAVRLPPTASFGRLHPEDVLHAAIVRGGGDQRGGGEEEGRGGSDLHYSVQQIAGSASSPSLSKQSSPSKAYENEEDLLPSASALKSHAEGFFLQPPLLRLNKDESSASSLSPRSTSMFSSSSSSSLLSTGDVLSIITSSLPLPVASRLPSSTQAAPLHPVAALSSSGVSTPATTKLRGGDGGLGVGGGKWIGGGGAAGLSPSLSVSSSIVDSSFHTRLAPLCCLDTSFCVGLSWADLHSLSAFVQHFVNTGILPWMERKARQLDSSISSNRKGFRNQLRYLWRKPKASTSTGGGQGSGGSPGASGLTASTSSSSSASSVVANVAEQAGGAAEALLYAVGGALLGGRKKLRTPTFSFISIRISSWTHEFIRIYMCIL